MTTLILIIIAYLLGSIPTGLWIGQKFYHLNLREHGSGNTGTTNTFRILGVKAGILTLVIDILKGTLAVLIPILIGYSTISPIAIGFFAILGHTFPVFAKFKGGKAVATSAGVLLGFSPLFLFYLLVIFLVTLFLFSMISLSSITVAILGIVGVLFFPLFHFIFIGYDWLFTFIVCLMASIILIRHKDNIKRIKKRRENLVPWGLNLSRQRK
ncbi:glycerol-3-phosphate acyltransferase [Streptococcus urinalis FB127-CNA-2]|uniref:Glycerol-3-phosphate acyltransferase n=1 Tax=Streptococcus urinalis 2285-97 TaxID=764291 RepID=G5KGJ7_9STRE|nr:glycerol-3-phosphate 1-O-acyltransferase PlsY [Streptococcus urinalis]EHJ56224.1 acyl-phosphate glycerol 3-phosphate acyltransferase [Streptococcus urinalis 2285-97]EKS22365.1 glycerol-3-phosphate acyltransferase [Streptococcus urinalis FB127-CNA-2]VEF32178.1 membrane protein [Streptococcus urinalis]